MVEEEIVSRRKGTIANDVFKVVGFCTIFLRKVRVRIGLSDMMSSAIDDSFFFDGWNPNARLINDRSIVEIPFFRNENI